MVVPRRRFRSLSSMALRASLVLCAAARASAFSLSSSVRPGRSSVRLMCEGPRNEPFALLDVRVGKILEAWPHPDSEKLWCEKIDVGEEEPREIASGIRAYYESKEELEGKAVLVVCNLKPAKLGGFPSNGMVLCGSSENKAVVEFVEPPPEAVPGERVVCEGWEMPEPASPNQVRAGVCEDPVYRSFHVFLQGKRGAHLCCSGEEEEDSGGGDGGAEGRGRRRNLHGREASHCRRTVHGPNHRLGHHQLRPLTSATTSYHKCCWAPGRCQKARRGGVDSLEPQASNRYILPRSTSPPPIASLSALPTAIVFHILVTSISLSIRSPHLIHIYFNFIFLCICYLKKLLNVHSALAALRHFPDCHARFP